MHSPAFSFRGERARLARRLSAALALLALPSVTGQMLALDGGQHLQWAPTPTHGADLDE
jgi:hypothetical protein